MPVSHIKSFDVLRAMPRYFWILFVVFTITAGVLMLDHFRMYSSQATIILVQKNEKTAASADQVIHTVAELPKTLAFYNRLLVQFPEVKDPWVGMSNDERKDLWAERVFTERIDQSNLIHLRISADSSSDATLLAQKSVANLFQMVGRYYNIRTELDIRTIDPPIERVEISNPIGFFLTSISVGFLLAALLSTGIMLFSQSLGQRKLHSVFSVKQEKENTPLVPVDFGEIAKGMPREQQTLHREFIQRDPVLPRPSLPVNPPASTLGASVSATPVSQASAAPAPAQNLPFLEEGVSLEEYLFGSQNHDVSASENKKDADEAADAVIAELEAVKKEAFETPAQKTGEPTAEELKHRLNQLLRGEM